MATKKKVKLIPPDMKQCQVEKPNGNTFMTLGGVPGLVRCKNKPTVLVKETKAGKDGQKGSMTMCASCYEVFKERAPDMAKHTTVTVIVEDQPCT